MSTVSTLLADPRFVAACVAFITTACVSAPLAAYLARRERRHQREMLEREAAHQKELETHKSRLAERLNFQKLKDEAWVAAREKERARRREAIETLRQLLGKVEDEIPKFASSAPLTDDDVIRQSQRAFDLYGRVADVMRSLERSIRRSDFERIVSLKAILAEICVDFARDEDERNRPERKARLGDSIQKLTDYISKSDEVFERALVPWSDPDAAGRPANLGG